ncbi:hypothetical protein [Catellatospora tritici]|uniref:hypothetical protein n=1 Tax=Catellatospora tritici TaxID=2851566 RepID=UPI001C2DAC02|nr:hypothetical protein [Catellatospora tritici]MBV1851822.1 hypothetical protein [Catellatospora tritici]
MGDPSYEAEHEQQSETDYLREIERLARAVVEEAGSEGWLAFDPDDESSPTPLQRSVNELARSLRFTHFEDDGCLDHGF